MECAYYIKDWQLPAVNVFMDIYGVDAGCALMVSFEKHGSLGKAMIDTVHVIKASNGKEISEKGGKL